MNYNKFNSVVLLQVIINPNKIIIFPNENIMKTMTQSYCFAHKGMKTILKYNYFYALLIFVISKIQLQKTELG